MSMNTLKEKQVITARKIQLNFILNIYKHSFNYLRMNMYLMINASK